MCPAAQYSVEQQSFQSDGAPRLACGKGTHRHQTEHEQPCAGLSFLRLYAGAFAAKTRRGFTTDSTVVGSPFARLGEFLISPPQIQRKQQPSLWQRPIQTADMKIFPAAGRQIPTNELATTHAGGALFALQA
jgi:hypothetical protein